MAYLRIGCVFPFLNIVNEVLEQRGIKLPLAPQGTTTMENRCERGSRAQVDIFGEGMRDFLNSDLEETDISING